MRNTTRYLTPLAIGLLTAGMARGQAAPSAENESLTTHTCATSGSGPTYMKICISQHGNVTKFESPQGVNHMRVYAPGAGIANCDLEGYGLNWGGEFSESDFIDAGHYEGNAVGQQCNFPGDDYYDWQEPYLIEQPNGPNTFPLRIYRKTDLLNILLKQEFTRDTTERELTVKMTLTLGLSTEWVVLGRIMGFANPGWTGNRSHVAWPGSGIGNAVAITVIPDPGDWEDCDPYSSHVSRNQADCSISTVIPAGASRTVKYVYRAF
jgi:hypothetical protein